jgi:hypothetical protein
MGFWNLHVTNDNQYLFCSSGILCKFKTYWYYTPVEEDVKEENLIYPNPTDGLVFIKINSKVSEPAQINLVDVQGKNLYEEEIHLIPGKMKSQ